MDARQLSKEMTEKEADRVMFYWSEQKPEKYKSAQALIRLGDSKTLAVATEMLQVEKGQRELIFYRFACEN